VSTGNPIFRNAILASSEAGMKLLSRDGRRLKNDDNKNNNNSNNNKQTYNQDFSATWIANYTIRFSSCHSIANLDRNGAGAKNQIAAKFHLCPGSGSCNKKCSSKGAEYMADMIDFVEAFLQSKKYVCEIQKENCQYYCNKNGGYYTHSCLYTCLSDAGYGLCNQGENNDFYPGNYVQCQKLVLGDSGNNDQYYIGAYCANNGKEVRLGVFTNSFCTKMAPKGTYEKLYGSSLPYSTTSIVSNDCLSCKQVYNNQGGQVTEACQNLYQVSAKCEGSSATSGITYPDNESCDFIHNTVPRIEKLLAGKSLRAVNVSTVFAWFFCITTVVFGLFGSYLLTKARRLGVDLAGQGSGEIL
jgi:hypothetical protein